MHGCSCNSLFAGENDLSLTANAPLFMRMIILGVRGCDSTDLASQARGIDNGTSLSQQLVLSLNPDQSFSVLSFPPI